MIIFSLGKWTRWWSQARLEATSRALIGRLTLESENWKQICVFRIIDCYPRLIVVRISGVGSPKSEQIDWALRECGQTWFINLPSSPKFLQVCLFLLISYGFWEFRLTTPNSCSKLSIGMKNSRIHFLFTSIGKVFSARSLRGARDLPANGIPAFVLFAFLEIWFKY